VLAEGSKIWWAQINKRPFEQGKVFAFDTYCQNLSAPIPPALITRNDFQNKV
jgi:hypothetical protein